MRLITLKQTGDTIVEAMVAVSVVGLVIASSFAIATRSLKSARQSQERGEALKIAESQVESVRSVLGDDSNSNDVHDEASIFCLENGRAQTIGGLRGSIPDLTSPEAQTSLNVATYGPECSEGLYHIAIDGNRVGAIDEHRYQFTVVVRWFGIGESPVEEVRLEYRIYHE